MTVKKVIFGKRLYIRTFGWPMAALQQDYGADGGGVGRVASALSFPRK